MVMVRHGVKENPEWECLLSKEIGHGSRRRVYVHSENSDWVIKKIRSPDMATNKYEWAVWQLVKDMPDFSCWVVPCVTISDCETYLVQERGVPIKNRQLPSYSSIPYWVRMDFARANWVDHEGKPKLCDYDNKQLQRLKEVLKYGS